MKLIIFIIWVVSIIIGLLAFKICKLKTGLFQAIITYLIPLFIYLWGLKKLDYIYGGTDIEFLCQTAFIDKMYIPQIIMVLILFIIPILFLINMIALIVKLIKAVQKNNN